jgi:hypothetical protein
MAAMLRARHGPAGAALLVAAAACLLQVRAAVRPGVRCALRLHPKAAVRVGSVGSQPLTSTLPARSRTGAARAGPSHEARSTVRAALRQEQHVQHASPVLRVHRRRVRGGSQRLRSGHPRALRPKLPCIANSGGQRRGACRNLEGSIRRALAARCCPDCPPSWLPTHISARVQAGIPQLRSAAHWWKIAFIAGSRLKPSPWRTGGRANTNSSLASRGRYGRRRSACMPPRS